VRTTTRLILPPTVLTVIPRFGAVSLLPPPGVIDNRTSFAAAPDPLTLAWLPPWLAAAVEPPEQAATSNPSVAQTATAASPWPRSPEDRKEMTCEMAAGRNFEAPDCTDTAYAAPAHPTPVTRLTPVRTTPGHSFNNCEGGPRRRLPRRIPSLWRNWSQTARRRYG